MAGNNSNFKITDLDFNRIKTNLKTFLQSQDVLKDYNYEGSALSTLLDILSYNTQYNAYYLNMVANEMFLDSALKRSSVVSQAKLLNYVPKSAIAPTAIIDLRVNQVNDLALTLPKFTAFISEAIDGVNYNFVTTDSYTVNTNSSTAYFSNISIKQGIPTTTSFTVDTVTNPKLIFELPETNVDTTSLIVSVQQSGSNNEIQLYSLADDFLALTGDSTVYFLQEGINGKYELYFGDGILGKKLIDGNIIKATYLVTQGTAAAGANNFVLMNPIGGYSNTVLYPIISATQGGEKETIDSIKFQAPKSFGAQKRAVTKEDYITAIQQNKLGFSFDSVSVWGGEQNEPPVYGKVFVSLKPSGGYSITQSQKQKIISNVISPISMMTVEPTIVDPDYTYLKLKIDLIYDPKRTTLTPSGIEQLVRSTVYNFASTNLNTFNATFSATDLTIAIRGADNSILTNEASLQLQKKFYPVFGASRNYKFNYGAPIKKNNFLSGINSSPSFSFISDTYGTLNDVYIEELASATSGVESISILNPGFGYQYAPTVTIVGDGIGATATASINNNGSLKSVTVNNPGTGYTTAYVVFTPAKNDTTGQSAAAYVNLVGRYGTLRTYYNNSVSGKTIIDSNVGTIDYDTGTINLISFNPLNVNDPLGQLTLTVTPTTSIISSSYNRIITIDPYDPNAVIINVIAKT